MNIKIASHDDIVAAREEWNALVSSMRFPSVFLTWEWIYTWIRHFGNAYNLMVIFVYDGERLSAILPLVQRSMKLEDGVFRTEVITICGCLELYPDHLDIICSKEKDAYQYLQEIFRFFTEDCSSWDTMYLPFLAENGNLTAFLPTVQGRVNLRCNHFIRAPYVPLDKDIDAYLAENMSQKRRHELRRQKRVLYEKEKASFHTIQDIAELDRYLDYLFTLHTARKRDAHVSSTFADTAVVDFHRDVAQLFQERGWLGCYLVVDEKENPVSVSYGFVYDNRYSYYQSGMDPQWNRFSPGKMIIFSMYEDLHAKSLKELDFLGGDQEYKTFWTEKYREMRTYTLYNRSIMGRIESMASLLWHMVKGCSRQLLTAGKSLLPHYKNLSTVRQGKGG